MMPDTDLAAIVARVREEIGPKHSWDERIHARITMQDASALVDAVERLQRELSDDPPATESELLASMRGHVDSLLAVVEKQAAERDESRQVARDLAQAKYWQSTAGDLIRAANPWLGGQT